MDTVKNWYRSKSMNFQQPSRSNDRPYDFGNSPAPDFKAQSYGPTDRALKTATEVCKKLTPSTETKNTVVNAVEHYGRKLIPNEATKQKVSRFYESQVAKLKYSQLKEGYQPAYRDDLTPFSDEDSFYGNQNTDSSFRHPHGPTEREVPTFIHPQSRLRTNSLTATSAGIPAAATWDGTFMRYPPSGKV